MIVALLYPLYAKLHLKAIVVVATLSCGNADLVNGPPRITTTPASEQSVQVQLDPELLRQAVESTGQVHADQAVENASAHAYAI